MNEILKYLKKHGERLDAEIAQAVGISLVDVRKQLIELTAKGEGCRAIRSVSKRARRLRE
jgi:predicted ArsR family transcriptional regulator